MDLPTGLLSTLGRWIRDYLTDRPSLAVVAEVVDRGLTVEDFDSIVVMKGRSGATLDVTVHNDGERPLRIAGVGVMGDKGASFVMPGGDPLPAIIQPAETLERYESVEILREALAGQRAVRIYVDWGVEGRWKYKLPRGVTDRVGRV